MGRSLSGSSYPGEAAFGPVSDTMLEVKKTLKQCFLELHQTLWHNMLAMLLIADTFS